jgi:hypothetical protein
MEFFDCAIGAAGHNRFLGAGLFVRFRHTNCCRRTWRSERVLPTLAARGGHEVKKAHPPIGRAGDPWRSRRRAGADRCCAFEASTFGYS